MESFSSILTVKCPGSFNSLVKVHRNVEYTKGDRVLGPPNVAFITSSKPCMRAKRYRVRAGVCAPALARATVASARADAAAKTAHKVAAVAHEASASVRAIFHVRDLERSRVESARAELAAAAHAKAAESEARAAAREACERNTLRGRKLWALPSEPDRGRCVRIGPKIVHLQRVQ